MSEYFYFIMGIVLLISYGWASFLAYKERKEYEEKADKVTKVLSDFAKAWSNRYQANISMQHRNEMYEALKMISTLEGEIIASMKAKEVLEKIEAE